MNGSRVDSIKTLDTRCNCTRRPLLQKISRALVLNTFKLTQNIQEQQATAAINHLISPQIMFSLADPRTKDWPMMSSPFHTLAICLGYVYIVKVSSQLHQPPPENIAQSQFSFRRLWGQSLWRTENHSI